MARHGFRPAVLVAALAAAFAALSSAAFAQQELVLRDGKSEYAENCAVCHGDSGKGNGRLAEILNIPPPDLTQISKRNNGVFPFWHVYQTIDGEYPVKGHMFSPMPIWVERFGEDESKPGYMPAYVRMLVLVHYLESIQEK
jgi:mono/diheme cytochrome c family protein